MKLLDYSNFYLVGIKGVGMTSLAQCLLDAGKNVAGCDVNDQFVTQDILNGLNVQIDAGFDKDLPSEVDCLIYTAAHGGVDNPIVQQAIKAGLPTFSHAEALGELFNSKRGIGVCGVGGKTTVSAMISWILNQVEADFSFSVGVGNIPGLEKTGQWSQSSEYFIAEADEYVVDPGAVSKGEKIKVRFSFLKPYITVCTNLNFDHPDVYRDFNHTKQVFGEFFDQIKESGVLIINGDDQELVDLASKSGKRIISFGENQTNSFQLANVSFEPGVSRGEIIHNGVAFNLELMIPGKFNLLNAVAAVAACNQIGINIDDSIKAISSFKSVKRRFELIGIKNGVTFYDDYAHHPSEVRKAIQALNNWFPTQRKIIAFQSHTFSRTKKLFNDFVDAFSQAKEVVMIDIFASAREEKDDSVSSEKLCKQISAKYPDVSAINVREIEKLAEYLQSNPNNGDVCLTIGAGDIYKVHDLI